MFQIIRYTLHFCWEMSENLYSRVIRPLLKFSQIRGGWMKIDIVPSSKVMNLHIVLYRCMLFTMHNDIVYTRIVRKLSSHFEYPENRSRSLFFNLAASHRRPYCASGNNHSPVGLVSRQWDAADWAAYCVTVAFTMTERADQLHHDNASAHSTALVQFLFFLGGGGQSIT